MSAKLFAQCFACGSYAEALTIEVDGQTQFICKDECQFAPPIAEKKRCVICGMEGPAELFDDINQSPTCFNEELCHDQYLQRLAEQDAELGVEFDDLDKKKEAKARFNEWLNGSDPVLGEYLW